MRVLYATDGGEPALHALALFERTAARGGVQVSAVTVVRAAPTEDDGSPDAISIAESAVGRLTEAGFQAEPRLLEGHPGTVVVRELEEGGFDLALLGAGNRTRLGRLVLGSVSTKVLHASSVSAMIVHRASNDTTGARVLFGTDGSEHAEHALEKMIALLDPARCQVVVISVAEHLMPQLSFPAPRAAYATSAPTPEQEREWTADAQKAVKETTRRLEDAGFSCEGKAVLGAPASRLLAEADEVDADLVVVGSVGRNALERIALGSISDQVAREAAAALIVRH